MTRDRKRNFKWFQNVFVSCFLLLASKLKISTSHHTQYQSLLQTFPNSLFILIISPYDYLTTYYSKYTNGREIALNQFKPATENEWEALDLNFSFYKIRANNRLYILPRYITEFGSHEARTFSQDFVAQSRSIFFQLHSFTSVLRSKIAIDMYVGVYVCV